MTFENALEKIQAKFAEVDGTKLADMAVQVDLTDEDCGGTLYFKVTNGVIDVQGYDYRDNDAVIDIARKSLMDILSGKTTLDKAIEKGQATAKGDFDKLDTLKTAIPKYEAPSKKNDAKAEDAPKAAPAKRSCGSRAKKETAKAAPAKNTAAKKTAAKKTAAKKEA